MVRPVLQTYCSSARSLLTLRCLAENNPANDYPDEELSWDDEEDDAAAIYKKYRQGSDDEDFEWDGSDSESGFNERYGRPYADSDDDGW